MPPAVAVGFDCVHVVTWSNDYCVGLGHSYSRAKVKFNVHRSDNMIIQSISLLDQLDKDINTFAMRIRYCMQASVINMSKVS